MIMTTGRVLLVCALCVLWCGAVLGHAMEDYCGEGGGNGLRHTSNGGDDGVSLKADCGLLSTRMALIKAVEAAEGEQEMNVTARPQDNSKASSPDSKVGNNTKSTGAPDSKGGSVAGEPAEAAPTPGESDTEGQVVKPEGLDANGGKKADGKRDRNDGTATGPQQQRADQPSSSSSSGSSGTESAKQPLVKENSERNETLDDPPQEEEEKDRGSESDSHEEEAEELEKKEDKKNASNQAPTGTLGGLTKHTEIHTATTEPNGQSSPQALGDVEKPEEVQGEKDPKNNSQTKSVASIAANQQNETSADHGESGSPSPTANGDAANNDSDNSTEERMQSNHSAADGAGTAEGKQNENKDANPKGTPVEATAMKTTTATTGDSDGSTAVSHTTSPLFLLLLVACAAAAAVVAA
ncbi:Mucin-associated surface protein (MASP) [Trypanosoma cruzi]|uniref:Mucin-associated surface protein (MASP), putative n=2 Tax=Trypanosoma cruzi TaxID=5693 RepID=Q4E202_TRYCC|nr:mucin-associated surface protein (MASP), putative [Trypanosoma cruzi]EAN98813.1 mucin-associated surface protein (MASP), putative [Trypanosoma cruzi]PWV15247.1 Mucin-associated surface protein (MASP) [Trypanosoma cruzi]|eukprot:XP_820664.1 mucin-associated surface protein (MASP) [Trypanosoma cruzi strain CL Brener]